MIARSGRGREHAENFVLDLAESLRDSVVEMATRPKFGDAEKVVMGLLDERIEAISAKTKPTIADQQQCDHLKLLKMDLREALDERWNTRKTFGPEK